MIDMILTYDNRNLFESLRKLLARVITVKTALYSQ